ncbi:MAG: cofilin [Watsoniomyces obsoletus]|nr:MAG: cofilin [Watsoniomyces obsoletus]
MGRKKASPAPRVQNKAQATAKAREASKTKVTEAIVQNAEAIAANKPARPTKRQLLRWTAELDQLLLLVIQSVCNQQKIKLPWDQIAEELDAKASEGAITQHLGKLRGQLTARGIKVPAGLRKGGSNGGAARASSSAGGAESAGNNQSLVLFSAGAKTDSDDDSMMSEDDQKKNKAKKSVKKAIKEEDSDYHPGRANKSRRRLVRGTNPGRGAKKGNVSAAVNVHTPASKKVVLRIPLGVGSDNFPRGLATWAERSESEVTTEREEEETDPNFLPTTADLFEDDVSDDEEAGQGDNEDNGGQEDDVADESDEEAVHHPMANGNVEVMAMRPAATTDEIKAPTPVTVSAGKVLDQEAFNLGVQFAFAMNSNALNNGSLTAVDSNIDTSLLANVSMGLADFNTAVPENQSTIGNMGLAGFDYQWPKNQHLASDGRAVLGDSKDFGGPAGGTNTEQLVSNELLEELAADAERAAEQNLDAFIDWEQFDLDGGVPRATFGAAN